ncbi:MAG TPA: hypothetical protein VJ023_13715 [Pyrinomonadaceae bacterium]|jgi:hypothetical protein|nr:hypothetical protein [Pyrinomonadaceae bacterium]
MSEARNALRVAGMILLGIFVVMVGIPLVFKAVGIALGIVGTLIQLAVGLLYLAVILAVGYLILVGMRALLR